MAGEGRGFLGFAEAPQARAPLGRQCLCPAYSEGPQGHDRGARSFQSPESADHAVPRARPPLPLHTHSRRGLGAPVSARAPAYPGLLGCGPVANTTRL